MKIPATPQERAAFVRMVAASAKLIVVIGRCIADHAMKIEEPVNFIAAEFVDAIIQVQEES